MRLHEPVPQTYNCIYEFVDDIVHGNPSACSAKEALIAMKILDAIYESAAKNEPVQIQY